jgi:3'-phosphoadenosine 5'-phosphosulfate sulfotransferase (PAPS reductase)/FAD synthetase
MNIQGYDKYIVAFSGGKDSTACFLWLLENGISTEKIELWHCLVDGRESEEAFMDWEVTEDYCRKFAAAFNVPIYFAWKQGGFEREMLRENQLTAPILFETPEGIMQVGGTRGKYSTRRKFPQVSADLNVRWCSAYLKIDVSTTAIRNQSRFAGLKTLVLSGERGEESDARAKYKTNEPDRADLRNGKVPRHVERHRPIKDWLENSVWEIIEKYNVVVHPCYYMGWSRCSCKFCIFGDADQMASAYKCGVNQGHRIVNYERDFNTTVKRKKPMLQVFSEGQPYAAITPELTTMATSKEYTGRIFTDNWILPPGAYGKGCGPS